LPSRLKRCAARSSAKGPRNGPFHLHLRHYRLAAAPQHRGGYGEQFARIERLGQIVVGADFQADDAVDIPRRARTGMIPADCRCALMRRVSSNHHRPGSIRVHDHKIGHYHRHAFIHLGRRARFPPESPVSPDIPRAGR